MLLEGLETLSLLASEGTMAKVASRLYISQSAVSKRIAQLEQRLGKKLIEPEGRQIRLTPQAKELLERVAPSLAEMKGVLADSQDLADQSPLPIACSETLLAGYLAHFMRDYLERDPHLALSTHHTPVILARVRSGDALLGICAGRLPPGHGLGADLLLEEPFYLVGETQQSLPPASAESRRSTPIWRSSNWPRQALALYCSPLACWDWWANRGRWPAHCPGWAAPCIWSTDQTA